MDRMWIFRDVLEGCTVDKCYSVKELTKTRKDTVTSSRIKSKDDFYQIIEKFRTFKYHDLCFTYYTFKVKINTYKSYMDNQLMVP